MVRAKSRRKPFELVLDEDKSRPEAERTTFLIRQYTPRQLAEASDLMLSFAPMLEMQEQAPEGIDEESLSLHVAKEAVDSGFTMAQMVDEVTRVFRLAVCGWRNYKDDDDQDIEYRTDDGGLVAQELIDEFFTLDEMVEIGVGGTQLNKVGGTDRKK